MLGSELKLRKAAVVQIRGRVVVKWSMSSQQIVFQIIPIKMKFSRDGQKVTFVHCINRENDNLRVLLGLTQARKRFFLGRDHDQYRCM